MGLDNLINDIIALINKADERLSDAVRDMPLGYYDEWSGNREDFKKIREYQWSILSNLAERCGMLKHYLADCGRKDISTDGIELFSTMWVLLENSNDLLILVGEEENAFRMLQYIQVIDYCANLLRTLLYFKLLTDSAGHMSCCRELRAWGVSSNGFVEVRKNKITQWYADNKQLLRGDDLSFSGLCSRWLLVNVHSECSEEALLPNLPRACGGGVHSKLLEAQRIYHGSLPQGHDYIGVFLYMVDKSDQEFQAEKAEWKPVHRLGYATSDAQAKEVVESLYQRLREIRKSGSSQWRKAMFYNYNLTRDVKTMPSSLSWFNYFFLNASWFGGNYGLRLAVHLRDDPRFLLHKTSLALSLDLPSLLPPAAVVVTDAPVVAATGATGRTDSSRSDVIDKFGGVEFAVPFYDGEYDSFDEYSSDEEVTECDTTAIKTLVYSRQDPQPQAGEESPTKMEREVNRLDAFGDDKVTSCDDKDRGGKEATERQRSRDNSDPDPMMTTTKLPVYSRQPAKGALPMAKTGKEVIYSRFD